jgi:LCP family protein required for cell wall assembly
MKELYSIKKVRGRRNKIGMNRARNKKIVISIIISILLICVAVGGYIYKVFVIDAKHIEKVFTKKSQVSKNSPLKYPFDDSSVNILIVGLDKASNRTVYDMHRTDTILFININFKDKKVRGISIPRDTLTQIYKVEKWDKINSAFGYGGGEKKEGFIYTMETVSKLLGGMPIDYYVGFDLDAIRKVVNILGGVYVNVEVPVRVKTKWVDIDLKPGYQKLNGIETLYYALWRKTPGGDIDRIKRDKELILSVFQQLKESNKIIKLPEIYWKIRKHFFTNLSLQQITSLAYFAQSMNKEDIVFESIPGTYFNYAGVSYWKPDYEGIKKLVKDLLGYDIEIDLQLPDRFKYTPRIVKHKTSNSSQKTVKKNPQIIDQEHQRTTEGQTKQSSSIDTSLPAQNSENPSIGDTTAQTQQSSQALEGQQTLPPTNSQQSLYENQDQNSSVQSGFSSSAASDVNSDVYSQDR